MTNVVLVTVPDPKAGEHSNIQRTPLGLACARPVAESLLRQTEPDIRWFLEVGFELRPLYNGAAEITIFYDQEISVKLVILNLQQANESKPDFALLSAEITVLGGELGPHTYRYGFDMLTEIWRIRRPWAAPVRPVRLVSGYIGCFAVGQTGKKSWRDLGLTEPEGTVTEYRYDYLDEASKEQAILEAQAWVDYQP
jgi:hypothetical protein